MTEQPTTSGEIYTFVHNVRGRAEIAITTPCVLVTLYDKEGFLALSDPLVGVKVSSWGGRVTVRLGIVSRHACGEGEFGVHFGSPCIMVTPFITAMQISITESEGKL